MEAQQKADPPSYAAPNALRPTPHPAPARNPLLRLLRRVGPAHARASLRARRAAQAGRGARQHAARRRVGRRRQVLGPDAGQMAQSQYVGTHGGGVHYCVLMLVKMDAYTRCRIRGSRLSRRHSSPRHRLLHPAALALALCVGVSLHRLDNCLLHSKRKRSKLASY